MRDKKVYELADDIMRKYKGPEPKYRHYREDIYVPKPPLGYPFKMEIRPGCYDLDEDFLSEERIPNPKNMKIESDEMFRFEHPTYDMIRDEIHGFFSLEERNQAAEDKLLHKGGLLIIGPPGSGKSSLVMGEIENVVKENRVVFLTSSPYSMKRGLEAFRKLEPDRDLMCVMEDIDEIVRYQGEQVILEMMSGLNTPNHILFVATCNNPERLSAKLRRPGRFDRKFYVPNPPAEIRYEYLDRKFPKALLESDKRKIVALTEGMSFGHLRTIVKEVRGSRKVSIEEAVGYVKEDGLAEQKGAQPDYDSDDMCSPKKMKW